MNHITQKKHLENQLQSLKDYVPFCPNDALPKLMAEIKRTINKIQNIRVMKLDDLVQEVVFYTDVKESKVNYLNTD